MASSIRLWHPLSERDRICFHCPFDECYPERPNCPYNLARRASAGRRDWTWLAERILALRPSDQPLRFVFDAYRDLKLTQAAAYRADPGIRTWCDRDAGQHILYVALPDNRSGKASCTTSTGAPRGCPLEAK